MQFDINKKTERLHLLTGLKKILLDIDKAILRMATYELKYMTDVPYKVVINEAIMLAKEFAAQDSHKFVNGVLDKYVKAVNLSE